MYQTYYFTWLMEYNWYWAKMHPVFWEGLHGHLPPRLGEYYEKLPLICIKESEFCQTSDTCRGPTFWYSMIPTKPCGGIWKWSCFGKSCRRESNMWCKRWYRENKSMAAHKMMWKILKMLWKKNWFRIKEWMWKSQKMSWKENWFRKQLLHRK